MTDRLKRLARSCIPTWIERRFPTPDGTRAYVTNFSNAVSVIDTATNTVVTTIPVGQTPFVSVRNEVF
jgi:YVTN family beta-propeller protein